jgi:uncharacterized protein DUF6152
MKLMLRSAAVMALLALAGAAVGLRAHHAFEAEYDAGKVITISGTVTKLDWINPHAFIVIDSKDASGAVHSYRVEMGPPYALQRGGWKRDTIKIGDRVTVEGAAAAKNGKDEAGSMQTTQMVLASGQKLPMR